MACTHPIKILVNKYYREFNGEIVNISRDDYFNNGGFIEQEAIQVPCGKCISCLSDKANEWAFRCVLEASQHDKNCFITLTYAESPVTLVKKDLQDFIKRLRSAIYPVKIRYFACGEYGSKGKRPHYHIIIFGWCPDDLQFFFKSGKENIYLSDFVRDIWGKGHISIGTVTLDSARYVAKYLQKLQKIDDDLLPPFVLMSLKPGIGLSAFNENSLETDSIYLNGKRRKVPRYFLDKCEQAGFDVSFLKFKRLETAKLFEKDITRYDLIKKEKYQKMNLLE